MRVGPRVLVIASVAALCACSGGGDSGGGGGGSRVSPSSLTFTAMVNGSFPAYQDVVFTLPAGTVYVVGVYPAGVSPTTWLDVTDQGGTSSTRVFRFQVNTTSFSAGTRTTTFRLVAAAGDQSVLAYGDVQVTYVLHTFAVAPGAVASSFVIGSSVAPPTRTVTIGAAPGTAWIATADRTWVQFPSSGTTPSTVTLGFDPAGLATGTHQATVTFTSAAGTSSVAVTFTVSDPTLTVAPATVELAGPAGHDRSTETVQVRLDTGTNAYPWTASTTADWLELVQPSATVSGTATSLTVRVTDATATWPNGTWSSTITVTADVNGTTLTRTVPVSYRRESLRLLVSDDGVALTSTPGISRLTRSVRVSTNLGLLATWSAESDRPWLTPRGTGTTDDPLVLTANPTGLGADTVHEATVTVSSSDPGVVGPVTVHVGLWVGSSSPEPLTTVTIRYWSVVTDPVRPYAYLSTGPSSSVAVYNVHTGALVRTIALPGTTVAMAVSSDGTRLFAVDETQHAVVPVDLSTWSPGAAWSLPAGARYTRLAFARPNGIPVLVTNHGSLHDPDTGASWGTFSVPTSAGAVLVAASRNGSRVCAAEQVNTPYTLQCTALDATTAPGSASPILTGPTQSRTGTRSDGAPPTYAHDVALSADGTRAYVAANATDVPHEFTIYDATASTLPVLGALPGAWYPTSVDVGWDDRVYCGAAHASATSAWVYDAAGVQEWSYQLGNVSRQQLVVSGDALRIVALTGDANTSTAVKFVTVAP